MSSQVILLLDFTSKNSDHNRRDETFLSEFYSNNINYQKFTKTIRFQSQNRLKQNESFLECYKWVELIFRGHYIEYEKVKNITTVFNYSIFIGNSHKTMWSRMEKLNEIVKTLSERKFGEYFANLIRNHLDKPNLLFVIGTTYRVDWKDLIRGIEISPELTKHLLKVKSHYSMPQEMFKIRHVVSELVKTNVFTLKKAINFRSDREIVHDACVHNPLALQYASFELRNDKEFVMKFLGRRFNTLLYVGEKLLSDSQVLRKGIMSEKEWREEKFDSMDSYQLMEQILKKRPIMVLKFYHLLKDKGLEFKIDRVGTNFEIVIEKSSFEITQRRRIWLNQANLVRHIENPDVALKVVASGFCERFSDCKDHLVKLTHSKYPNLTNLSMETEEERYIIQNHWNGLFACKEELRNDKQFVMEFLKRYSNRKNSILTIGESLLLDSDILKEYLISNGQSINEEQVESLMKQIVSFYPLSILRFYKYLQIECDINSFSFTELSRAAPMIQDTHIAALFIRRNYSLFYLLSHEMKKDISLVRIIFFEIGRNIDLDKFPSECLSDREIVTHILTTKTNLYEKERSVCKEICKEFQYDIEIMKLTVNKFGSYPLSFISKEVFLKNLDFCYWLIDCNYSFFEKLPEQIRTDRDFVFEKLDKLYWKINYVKNITMDFVMKCIRKNRICYKYFGSEFRENRQVIDLALEMGVVIGEITKCEAFSEHLWDKSPDGFIDNLCYPGYRVFLTKDLLKRAIERNSLVWNSRDKWRNYPGCSLLSAQDWKDLEGLI